MNMDERIDTLRGAGFTIRYADIRRAYSWADPHVSYDDPQSSPIGEYNAPYVEFGDIGSGDDAYDQTTTWQRSNFRRLLQDYGRKLVPIHYVNVDGLGAFVVNLDDDLLNTIIGLREQYPIYDESDMGELESEEISEAWDRYLYWDTINSLPDDLRDRADVIGQTRLGELFYSMCSDMDYFPEHGGLDIHWDHEKVREIVERAIESA